MAAQKAEVYETSSKFDVDSNSFRISLLPFVATGGKAIPDNYDP
jgi:hypothetical protein